jgi:hypothetical protein
VPVERFDLAERVAVVARGLGIETALIGAAAFAFHRYVRATKDIDLASDVNPFEKLPLLEAALRQEGFRTRLVKPDADDPLGGSLRVWTAIDDDGEPVEPVELVNFDNPYARRRGPAGEAIRTAIPVEARPTLRCVQLPFLVAMKLDAGGLADLADVVELLRLNRDAFEEVRATCKRFGFDIIDQLIAHAEHER